MQFLDQETPIAIGQMVIHPEHLTRHVIIGTKDKARSTEAKLSAIHGWQDVLLWDRYVPTIEELAIVIAIKEDVIADHVKAEEKANAEIAAWAEDYDELNKRFSKQVTIRNKVESDLSEAQEKLAECELMRGKAKHDFEEKIKDLEAELGNLRGVAIKNQEDANQVEIKTRQVEEAEGIIASQKRTLERYRNRLSLMMNPTYRIKHQKTAHNFITITDDVDTAPQDVVIAGMLDEGWHITSINLKPTWLYDEEVKHRTVSHTRRYITLQRYSVPADDDETEEEVKLPQSMDEAINAAIGKNDGSHIGQLTMPIELADEALYGEVQS